MVDKTLHVVEDVIISATEPLLHSGSIVIAVFTILVLMQLGLIMYLFYIITRLAKENTRLVDLMANMNERMFETLSVLTTRMELLPSELIRLIGK